MTSLPESRISAGRFGLQSLFLARLLTHFGKPSVGGCITEA